MRIIKVIIIVMKIKMVKFDGIVDGSDEDIWGVVEEISKPLLLMVTSNILL